MIKNYKCMNLSTPRLLYQGVCAPKLSMNQNLNLTVLVTTTDALWHFETG